MATTKLVLNRDVENLGRAGDVVEVRAGYARNYLLPRGFAAKWTKGTQRHIDQALEAKRRHDIQSIEDAVALRERVQEGQALEVSGRAGRNGRLFGAVTAKHVAEAFTQVYGVKLDSRKVELSGTIKALGEYPVAIKLHPEVVARTTVQVVGAN